VALSRNVAPQCDARMAALFAECPTLDEIPVVFGHLRGLSLSSVRVRRQLARGEHESGLQILRDELHTVWIEIVPVGTDVSNLLRLLNSNPTIKISSNLTREVSD
jgi:hypothetical protein